MDLVRVVQGKQLTNCVPTEGFFGNVAYKPVCPNCKNEGMSSFTPMGAQKYTSSVFCRNCGTKYNVEVVEASSSIERNNLSSNLDVKLKFSKRQKLIADNIVLPIPDGYHGCDEGTDENANWCYIVPSDYSLMDNHIDAKPFSFGVTNQSFFGWRLLPDPSDRGIEYSEFIKLLLLKCDALDETVYIDEISLSKDCIVLYQNFYDSNDCTYNKIKGFICAGSDVRMFHIYRNHEHPVADLQDTIDEFLSESEKWISKIKYKGEIEFS